VPADKEKIKAALTTLLSVFEASLRLLSPFMPFITEEIWHASTTATAGQVDRASELSAGSRRYFAGSRSRWNLCNRHRRSPRSAQKKSASKRKLLRPSSFASTET